MAYTTRLEVSHQGYATAVLAPFCLGAPWGQRPPSCAFPMGHGSLTSSLCSVRPTCFSAGKQGAALLVLTPRQRSLVPEGKKPAVHLAPARHVPQGITAEMHCGAFWLSSTLSPLGLFGYTTLAILKNSSAASRAMSRSCQSKGFYSHYRLFWVAPWSGSSPHSCSQVKPSVTSNLFSLR